MTKCEGCNRIFGCPVSASQLQALIALVLFAVVVRGCVSLGEYSGEGKGPMFGDYEAQRHWMEITLHTPVLEWYVNTPSNDLNYWGLDYPPLTAYGSWLCGKVANFFNPEWVALQTSRGIETPESKLFMRLTVLVGDVLFYILPCIFFCMSYKNVTGRGTSDFWYRFQVLMLLVMQPGLILIDHGHFQYNCVSLGLAVFAVSLVINDSDLLGSVAFCLSLNYKQMSLYYAPPFFFYLLGKAAKRKRPNLTVFQFIQALVEPETLFKIAQLGVCVVGTFAVLWWPFLNAENGLDSSLHVVKRIFPIKRGLFEDKVANFWFMFNIAVKLRNLYAAETLFKVSLMVTVAAFIPSSVKLMLRPSKENFLLALVLSSLSFYLFSFQVHEKTILLVTVPVSMLQIVFFFGEKRLLNTVSYFLTCNFLVISTFSMFSLLHKDGQSIQYFSVTLLFLLIACSLKFPSHSLSTYRTWFCMGVGLVAAVIIGAHFAFYTISPPIGKPDIHLYVFAFISFVHFSLFYVYFNCIMFSKEALRNPAIEYDERKKWQ